MENLLAALAQLLLAARHKGMRIDIAIKRQRSPLAIQGEWHAYEPPYPQPLSPQGRGEQTTGREAIGPLPLHAQAFQIEIGDEKVLFSLEAIRFRQDRAVLRDQAVPAESQVRGRFVNPARNIDITGQAA